MKKLLLIVLLCPVWQGLALEGEAAFKLVAQKMSTRKLAYNITYKLYNAHQQGDLLETQHMEVSQWGEQTSIKTALFHAIRNNKYYFYADHTRKLMLLNHAGKAQKEKELQQMQAQSSQNTELDSLLKASYHISLLQQKGEQTTYRLLLKNSTQYTQADVSINTREHTVSHMVLYYRQTLAQLLGKHNDLASGRQPRIEVSFHHYQFFTKEPARLFSLEQYLSKSAKSYKPLPAYQSYQFINYTLKPKKH